MYRNIYIHTQREKIITKTLQNLPNQRENPPLPFPHPSFFFPNPNPNPRNPSPYCNLVKPTKPTKPIRSVRNSSISPFPPPLISPLRNPYIWWRGGSQPKSRKGVEGFVPPPLKTTLTKRQKIDRTMLHCWFGGGGNEIERIGWRGHDGEEKGRRGADID